MKLIEVREELLSFLKGKSQRQAAKELGISAQYLNDILHFKRSITSPAILKRFGYRKRIIVEKQPLTKP